MGAYLYEAEDQQLKTAKACKQPGIYMIYCVSNYRSYIGSAHNLSKRLYEHRYELKNNKHANIHLQRIYNKYGINSLTFTVLEYVDDVEVLLSKEQEWINSLGNINICKIAGNTTGVTPSNETRKKLSKAGKGAIRSREFKEAVSTSTRLLWATISEADKASRIAKMKATKAARSEDEKNATKAKISQSRTGKPGPWKGKTLPEEIRLKISNSRKGVKLSEDHKLKIGNGVRNLPAEKKAEISAKLSAAHKGRKKSQQHIDAIRKAKMHSLSLQ